MRLRAALPLALTALLAVGLSACGKSDASSGSDTQTLKVGVSPVPHGQILKYVADNLAKDKGLKIEITEISDYKVPNTALVEGSLDANYFQHVPYLEQFQADSGKKLQWVTPVHLEPLGLYSKKAKKIGDIPDGGKVAVPNDPANLARSLNLLAQNGLLKLKDGTQRTATERDVADNPKHLQFLPLEAAQLPRSLDDTDASVINGNYALEANLNPAKDALVAEKAEGNPYANGLVTRPELAGDKRIQTLAELLKSKQVQDYIATTFQGAVIPAA